MLRTHFSGIWNYALEISLLPGPKKILREGSVTFITEFLLRIQYVSKFIRILILTSFSDSSKITWQHLMPKNARRKWYTPYSYVTLPIYLILFVWNRFWLPFASMTEYSLDYLELRHNKASLLYVITTQQIDWVNPSRPSILQIISTSIFF